MNYKNMTVEDAKDGLHTILGSKPHFDTIDIPYEKFWRDVPIEDEGFEHKDQINLCLWAAINKKTVEGLAQNGYVTRGRITAIYFTMENPRFTIGSTPGFAASEIEVVG